MAQRNVWSTDALNEPGDISAAVGSRAWAIAVRGELAVCLSDEESNRERIKYLTALLKDSQGYTQLTDQHGKPFTSWRAFCVADAPWGLEYDPDLIDAIVAEGERLTPQERVAIAAMETSGEVRDRGQRDEIGKFPISSQSDRGEQVGISDRTQRKLDYLARHAPDMLTAVRERTLSADAAYRQAKGKPKATSVELIPESIARTIIREFTPEQIAELIERLVPYLPIETS